MDIVIDFRKKTVDSLTAEKEDFEKKIKINEQKLGDFTEFHKEASEKLHALKNELSSLELEKK